MSVIVCFLAIVVSNNMLIQYRNKKISLIHFFHFMSRKSGGFQYIKKHFISLRK